MSFSPPLPPRQSQTAPSSPRERTAVRAKRHASCRAVRSSAHSRSGRGTIPAPGRASVVKAVVVGRPSGHARHVGPVSRDDVVCGVGSNAIGKRGRPGPATSGSVSPVPAAISQPRTAEHQYRLFKPRPALGDLSQACTIGRSPCNGRSRRGPAAGQSWSNGCRASPTCQVLRS